MVCGVHHCVSRAPVRWAACVVRAAPVCGQRRCCLRHRCNFPNVAQGVIARTWGTDFWKRLLAFLAPALRYRTFPAAGPLLRPSPRRQTCRASSIRAAAAPADKAAVAELEKQGLAASEAWDTVVTDFLDPGTRLCTRARAQTHTRARARTHTHAHTCMHAHCLQTHTVTHANVYTCTGLAAAAASLFEDRADIGFAKVGGYAAASRVRLVFTNPELLDALGTADDLAAEYTVMLSVSAAFDKAGNKLGAGGRISQKSVFSV